MAKKRFYDNEYYAGAEARRAQERKDGEMISEDHNAISNMPQNVVMREYPKTHDYLPEMIDDSLRGIDKQIRSDDEGKRKNFKPKKF
jgi:chromosome condensin MukBEF complex kleisin-like MukF subunit